MNTRWTVRPATLHISLLCIPRRMFHRTGQKSNLLFDNVELPVIFSSLRISTGECFSHLSVSGFSSRLFFFYFLFFHFHFPRGSLQEFTCHAHQTTCASTSASALAFQIHFQRHFRSGIYRTLFRGRWILTRTRVLVEEECVVACW